VVGRLLGKVRDSDGLAIAFDAVGGARGCGVGRLEGGMSILDLPVTLRESVGSPLSSQVRAYPEELAQCRVVGFARLALYVFLRQH
jgi:hypothetical protein